MAATLAMSGGGQEEPCYPLQKEALPFGFLLEDSVLFGLDCKVADKSVHNDYAQVTRSNAHTHDGFGGRGGGEWAWQIDRGSRFISYFYGAQTPARPMGFAWRCFCSFARRAERPAGRGG